MEHGGPGIIWTYTADEQKHQDPADFMGKLKANEMQTRRSDTAATITDCTPCTFSPTPSEKVLETSSINQSAQ